MTTSSSGNRLFAFVFISAIAIAGMRPSLLRALFTDTQTLRVSHDTLPPEMGVFLNRARAEVPAGETIAIVLLSKRTWSDGYSYPFFRAAFELAGRRCIRAMGESDDAALDRAQTAAWIVSWPARDVDGYESVLRESGGALLRRWK